MKLGSVPPGAQLRGLSLRVFQALSKCTAFPWAILQAQCKRADVDPMDLTPQGLAKVTDFLADGVARFSSAAKGDQVRAELTALQADAQYVGPEAVDEPGGILCPSCGVKVKIGRFCSSCGKGLRATKSCPKCAAPADGQFCSTCGAGLE